MCQVTPFTLPCCRRVYVSIAKLPSCPETWPKSKCPPELCIQLGGYEATHANNKQDGICWRCKAATQGAVGHERECLRPGVDKAFVVPGLIELGPADKRRLAELEGKCWFCSTRGCDMCGGKGKIGAEEGCAMIEKRQGDDKGRAIHKRLKTEENGGINQASSSILPNPFFSPYPEPGSQKPYSNPVEPSEYVPVAPPAPLFGILQNETKHYPSSIDPSLLNWLTEPRPHCLSDIVSEKDPHSLQIMLYGEQLAGGKLTEGQDSTEKSEHQVFHCAKQELEASSNFYQDYLNNYDAHIEMVRLMEAYTSELPTLEHSNHQTEDQGIPEAQNLGLANTDLQ